ncbi:hypothetical protein EXM22_01940 [Oceanispirochaeta crateris]|uniref:Uncharacterized protein n=1 Tax=Oceanispirochaeta crateris TaxID=2518645 RepID=A0A5C1QGX9_9SPIO|nr:hypothetical protein [Oceanispirochaeta crateris]QEN06811.1 hypothetical protein EXM22_01940 [Oceanispirochaeta crateris]
MDKKVYTPQIHVDSAFLLRRVAWAAEKPMTYTLDECIRGLVNQVDRQKLCGACRDHRCLECPVSQYYGKSGLDSILR